MPDSQTECPLLCLTLWGEHIWGLSLVFITQAKLTDFWIGVISPKTFSPSHLSSHWISFMYTMNWPTEFWHVIWYCVFPFSVHKRMFLCFSPKFQCYVKRSLIDIIYICHLSLLLSSWCQTSCTEQYTLVSLCLWRSEFKTKSTNVKIIRGIVTDANVFCSLFSLTATLNKSKRLLSINRDGWKKQWNFI